VLTLATVPLYLELIGVEKYGFLTLCWVILGYSGFLEWGLGSAVAQKVAAAGPDDPRTASDIFWNGLWLSLGLGAVGATLTFAGASLYFSSMSVTSAFGDELYDALPLLAAIAPILMLGGLFSGALQGRERFLALNLVGMSAYSLVAVFPLLIAYLWTDSLSGLVLGALMGRLITYPVGLWMAARALSLRLPRRPSRQIMKGLLGFGGWVALTQIANGILSTLDRLAIGGRIGAAAVPAYAIPFGLVSRIVVVPHSLAGALFPRFAAVDEAERDRLVAAAIKAVIVIVTPMTIAIVALADPFFRLWIGAELAAVSSPIAYILAASFWIYCIGHIPFSMIQAAGRPSLVSKLFLAELIPYALLLFAGLALFGLPGVAAAFALRLAGETAVLLYLARTPLSALKPLLVPGLLTAAAVLIRALDPGLIGHVGVACLLLAAALWSLFNVPDVLRPYLRPIAWMLPKPRAAPGG
jgi:O-antigen/teichoic acid export membrane protein